MNKEKMKGIVIGAVIMGIISLGINPVIAQKISKTINVVFNGMNIVLDGKKVNADNILYNGTTYVPLRAMAEMLGKDVVFDKRTNTANIGDNLKSEENDNLTNKDSDPVTTLYNDDGTVAYKGAVKDGKPHGRGKSYGTEWNMIYGTRSTVSYDGEWKNGKMDGFGISYRTFKDGYVPMYIGYYKNGEQFGAGADFGTSFEAGFLRCMGNNVNSKSKTVVYYFNNNKPSTEVVNGIIMTNEVKKIDLPYIEEYKPFIINDVDKAREDIRIKEIINVVNQYHNNDNLANEVLSKLDYDGDKSNGSRNGYGTLYNKDGNIVLRFYVSTL